MKRDPALVAKAGEIANAALLEVGHDHRVTPEGSQILIGDHDPVRYKAAVLGSMAVFGRDHPVRCFTCAHRLHPECTTLVEALRGYRCP